MSTSDSEPGWGRRTLNAWNSLSRGWRAACAALLIVFVLMLSFMAYQSAQPSPQVDSQKIFDNCVARYDAESDAMRGQYRAEFLQAGLTLLPSEGYDDSATTVALPIESFRQNIKQESITTVYQWDFDHGSRFFAISTTKSRAIYVFNAYVSPDYTKCYSESGLQEPDMGMCIIATAAYGSPMAPEVVYMRHVRDGLVGSTAIGRRLIQAFNAFYYSWSPPVAKVIAGSATLRAVFRVLLVPVSAIVHLAAWTFAVLGAGEFASVGAFTVSAILAVGTYMFLPISLMLMMLWRRRGAGAARVGRKP